jgi:hypothetical protein
MPVRGYWKQEQMFPAADEPQVLTGEIKTDSRQNQSAVNVWGRIFS